jgi:F-type H+-transporting ATPase subunit b
MRHVEGESLAERLRREGPLPPAEARRILAEANREAEELRERYRRQLDRAHEEAGRIVEEGRRRGEDARRDIVAKAERDAERIVARGEEQIRSERDRAVAEVRQDVGQLAVALAARIIGETIDAKRHQAMVDRFIDELTGSPLSSRDEGVRG